MISRNLVLETLDAPSSGSASLTILTTASLRVSRSSKVFSGVMRVILDRIVSCANCICGFSSRSSSELSGLRFAFASRSGTEPCGICSLLSVLCCSTGIHNFASESNLRHLDCFFSSPLGLWDLSLHCHANVNNLVDELRLGNSTVFCVSRAVGTCFVRVCVVQLSHNHIDDLFDVSL